MVNISLMMKVGVLMSKVVVMKLWCIVVIKSITGTILIMTYTHHDAYGGGDDGGGEGGGRGRGRGEDIAQALLQCRCHRSWWWQPLDSIKHRWFPAPKKFIVLQKFNVVAINVHNLCWVHIREWMPLNILTISIIHTLFLCKGLPLVHWMIVGRSTNWCIHSLRWKMKIESA